MKHPKHVPVRLSKDLLQWFDGRRAYWASLLTQAGNLDFCIRELGYALQLADRGWCVEVPVTPVANWEARLTINQGPGSGELHCSAASAAELYKQCAQAQALQPKATPFSSVGAAGVSTAAVATAPLISNPKPGETHAGLHNE